MKKIDSRSGTELRGRQGFTLIEMLVAFALFTVITGSAVGLLMSQRNLYHVQSDRLDLLRNVRASVDLVAGELRSVPPGGIISGGTDSVTVRYPYRWGLVCGYVEKQVKSSKEPPPPAEDAELYLPLDADGLYAGEAMSGFGFRDALGVWTFVEDTEPPWEDSLSASSLTTCAPGATTKSGKDVYTKSGKLITVPGDTTDFDYGLFEGFLTYTGFEGYQGAQIIAFSNVTYRFGPSTFEPGTRAIFRDNPNGPQELAGLFDNDSGFEYILGSGTVLTSLSTQAQIDDLVAIRILAFTTQDNQAGGESRTLDYDAEVLVQLRNFGG